MKTKTGKYFLIPLIYMVASCSGNQQTSDAYGNFEADEITISAEGNGRILQLSLEEGDIIPANKSIGYIDTTQLVLRKKQLLASRGAIGSKTGHIVSQIDVLHSQLENLNRERSRVENLLKDGAATQRQLDEINGQMNVIQQQVKAIESQNAPVVSELKTIDVQIDQVNDQIAKSIITNPVEGTVLVKLASENEMVAYGRPLYRIADMREMFLRVYVSAKQLQTLAPGQSVTVLIDGSNKKLDELNGTITWISPTAEFTPKTIQTREERVNMVYAIKVKVKNNGRLKIGMPGEINFSSNN